jgi:UDP-N-acetylmuramoyl-L-alanyl-D-glutamate--2,6-diaminopimelate ligase
VVTDVRAALGPMAAAFHGNPSRQLRVIGVTGTNGKTTTVHLIASIFERHGWSTGVLGTLSGARTTPEAPELQGHLAAERARGRDAVAMEVSSHALAMGRVRATRFAVAMFTNLSQDHLNFHRDMDEYFEAKASLFTGAYADAAVVNLDDDHGRILHERSEVTTIGYSIADAEDIRISALRSRFRWRGQEIDLALGGRFNVSNAIGAATVAEHLGVDRAAIADGLAVVAPVPGRFEVVDAGQAFTVAVDFAHTPDALVNVLTLGRELAGDHDVLVVFGCGGEKDVAKRPLMGEVAARLADRVVLTSDNPRGEDPLAIIEAVRGGIRDEAGLTIEPDRRSAIELAVRSAKPGDVVIIAGKGHEEVQIVGDEEIPFDDRAVALEALTW